MGHGRGQPDRLPLARPLARSLAHARGTGHPPGGKGTRYESHARGPTPGPASTRLAPPPHPTPPPPAQAGGRRRGWEAEGNTDGRRHGEARAGGHGDGRAGRGAAGKGAQRRPGRETPPAGGNARAAARRTGAGGGGGRQAREQREEKPGGRPPTAGGPPCLPLSPSTQPHARVRPRRPTTDGWLEAGRPTPWSDTKTPRARGHEAPRGHSPGGSARRRKDTAASRGPPPGHASPGRGHARDTASGRAARPDRARRCLGGRGARKEPQAARRTAAGSRPDTAATAAAAALGARGKREAAAARTRPPDRYRAGSQPRGAGTRPDAPTPPPAKHTMPKRPLAARGGSQRDGGGQGQRPRREPSGPSLPSHGRRAPPPRPRSRRRPPPANPPHRPTRAPSSERAAGAGRGGGWGAGQIRQEAEGARQCLHLGGRRAHGGPARTPQPRHPRRGKHPGGGD